MLVLAAIIWLSLVTTLVQSLSSHPFPENSARGKAIRSSAPVASPEEPTRRIKRGEQTKSIQDMCVCVMFLITILTFPVYVSFRFTARCQFCVLVGHQTKETKTTADSIGGLDTATISLLAKDTDTRVGSIQHATNSSHYTTTTTTTTAITTTAIGTVQSTFSRYKAE